MSFDKYFIDKINTMNIGQRIKALADSKNVSAKELAEKIGRTRQAVYDIYSGKVSINVDQLEKIALALDIEIVQLFIGDQQIRQSRDDIIKMMKTIFGRMIEHGYYNFFHIRQLMYNIYVHATLGEGLVNLNLKKVSGEYDYPFTETYKPLKEKLSEEELKKFSIVNEKSAVELTQILTYTNYEQLITEFVKENYSVE